MNLPRKARNGLSLLKGRFVDHDASAGFSLAEKASAWLYPPYRFSEVGQIWLDDKEFTRFLDDHVDEERRRGADRLFFLRGLLRLVEHLSGDVAECGSYTGTSTLLLCRGTESASRPVHVFDSFEGLSAPMPQDGGAWKRGDLAVPQDKLESKLADYLDRVHVHAGWIPQRFDDVADRSFCFVHIDVDLYQPSVDSLEFFYPRTVAGGMILMDDYGIASCQGQKIAADEFFADKPERIVHAPTGQGFVVKLPSPQLGSQDPDA